MFNSVPISSWHIIQNTRLRSVSMNNSTENWSKKLIPLTPTFVVKFAQNIHAASVHTPLQFFDKADKSSSNVFSNVTRIAFIKTRFFSLVSRGTIDFSWIGDRCNTTETYIRAHFQPYCPQFLPINQISQSNRGRFEKPHRTNGYTVS